MNDRSEGAIPSEEPGADRPVPALTTVTVVGTGLIGTSVALALSGRGVTVRLADSDPASVALATDLGAGRPAAGDDGPADVAVLAMPPASVPAALAAAQAAGLARWYTDVASVKAAVIDGAAGAGADLATFVGGHPVSGRERTGPAAARADLFEGRPWVLTPTAATHPAAVAAARSVVLACGAVPILLTPTGHDEALALVSHVPQLVSSAVATLVADAPDGEVALAGQGLRDLTRVAGSDAALWTEIATANAAAVANLLDRLVARLAAVSAALHERDGGQVTSLVRQGNAGVARLPGKHSVSAPGARFVSVPVVVEDRPGRLAALFADAGAEGINVEDVSVEHSPGAPVGVVELAVRPEQADDLAAVLRRRGWSVHR